MKSSIKVVMLPLCTAFIFLCAPFSIEAQPTDYARCALAAEREVYAAATTAEFNAALWRKLDCQKQAGDYADALGSLARLRLFALDAEASDRYYYERTLCAYLGGDYDAARATAAEAAMMVADTVRKAQISMIDGLAAAAKGDWKSAETVLARWADEALPSDEAAEFRARLAEFADKAPRMKNPNTGYYLSILPGAGQLYAAEVGSAAVAAVVNAGLIAYIVIEAVGGYYWTAWFVGAGLLSSTYFVNLERGRELTVQRNRRVAARYAEALKTMVLDAAE